VVAGISFGQSEESAPDAAVDASASASEAVDGIEDLDWAQVVYVAATLTGDNAWRFDVTVHHNDEGWDHYADLWQVVDPGTGSVLGERILLHPHVDEQPFTRSQAGVLIPVGVSVVLIRARCQVHEFGGREIQVDLTGPDTAYYEIRRP
jgi:hypothetical protein